MEFLGARVEWIIEDSKSTDYGIYISCNNPKWSICKTLTDFDYDHANALLISKAPNMLYMLKQLVLEFQMYKINAHGSTKCEVIIMAENLIKEITEIK